MERKWLFLSGVDHHDGLGDLGAPDDVVAVAHDAETTLSWGSGVHEGDLTRH
jgi:hypothetical protein